MGQVTVTLNGRTYRLRCDDGEEARLLDLAAFIERRVDGLAAEFGQVGDERLLLMAALLITDELWELREQSDQGDADAPEHPAMSPEPAPDAHAHDASQDRSRPAPALTAAAGSRPLSRRVRHG